MKDNDIVKELEVKNHELFVNKMIIDLETAKESLLMFFGNYCDTVSLEVNNVVNSYLDKPNDQTKEMISKLVLSFFIMVKEELNKTINERLTIIKENIKNINANNYEKRLNNEALVIVNKISEYYQENIYMLIDEIKDNINEHRLDFKDYLLNAVYLKLMNILKDKLMYTVKLINNNYDENTTMIQSINEKTLK